jgi:hypothetical protein
MHTIAGCVSCLEGDQLFEVNLKVSHHLSRHLSHTLATASVQRTRLPQSQHLRPLCANHYLHKYAHYQPAPSRTAFVAAPLLAKSVKQYRLVWQSSCNPHQVVQGADVNLSVRKQTLLEDATWCVAHTGNKSMQTLRSLSHRSQSVILHCTFCMHCAQVHPCMVCIEA